MHKENQPSPQDIIEWTARPFDNADIEISRSFRQGTLDCRDILAVEKYQNEGILGALVLPNSLVQYGIGWFRTVPIGFEGQRVDNPDAEGDPLKPKEKDDFSLKLLASIFIAANSKQEFQKAGGLADLLKCDLKFQKNLNATTEQACKETVKSTDGSVSKRALSENQETPPAKKYQSSTISNTQNSKESSSPLVRKQESETPPRNAPENTAILGIEHSSPAICSNSQPKNSTSNGNDSSDKQNSLTHEREFWQDIENSAQPPQKVTITSELELSYWADKFTPRNGFDLANFIKYVIHIFVASRSEAPSLSEEIDLSGPPGKCADRMLNLIRSFYSLPSSTKLDHHQKVIVNQALCLIGFHLSRKSNSFREEFVKKHSDPKFKKVSSADRIVSVALFLARLWDKNMPISRMDNLHVNFYKLEALLGEEGTKQMEEAIQLLQKKYSSGTPTQ